MPLTRSAKTLAVTHAPRRLRPLRPVTPNCRSGASSVLRLAQPGVQRLPTTLDLSDWISRAASVLIRQASRSGRPGALMPVTGPHAGFRSRSSASRV